MGELAHSIQKASRRFKLYEKERGEFLASVAHELRTPLTYIRGYADIILKQRCLHKIRSIIFLLLKKKLIM